MPANVPTTDEFNALAARVTKLEQGTTTGESPQGATITGPGTHITMADGTQVSLTAAGGQVQFTPGGVDTTTSNVITGLMWDHKFYQQNKDPGPSNWWYGTKGSWTGPVSDPRVAPTNPNYHVSNGQFIGPNGQPFKGRGVNIWADAIPAATANMTSVFPGINYARLNFSDQYGGMGNWPPSKLKQYIDTMTNAGIVVVIDPHDYPNIYQGDQLTRVCNFMQAQVQAFKGYGNVWYQTQNEPGVSNGGAGALMNMLKAIYTTCKNAGATAPILISGEGSYTIDGWTGIDHNTWASWNGIGWFLHYYNWGSSFAGGGAPSYSTDLNTNKKAVANLAAALQAAHSADGIMPVVIDEYGDSTNGDTVDPGWQATLGAVHQSGFGTAAWNWLKLGNGDVLIDPQPNTLTNPYGTTVRDHIRTGS